MKESCDSVEVEMRALFSLTLLALALACSGGSTQPGLCTLGPAAPSGPVTSVSGRFQYSACDGHGNALVLGTLDLQTTNGTTIGTWTARLAPGIDPTTMVGPQVGSGTISGHVSSNGSVTFTLGATSTGDRIDLAGAAVTQGFGGQWKFLSGGAVQAAGNYVAMQVTNCPLQPNGTTCGG